MAGHSSVPAAPVLDEDRSSSEDEQDLADANGHADGGSQLGATGGDKKKKKKKKGKRKGKNALPPLSWDDPLVRISPYNVIDQDKLDIFRTPGCRFTLHTSARRRVVSQTTESSAGESTYTSAKPSLDSQANGPDRSDSHPAQTKEEATDAPAREPGKLVLRAVELADEAGIQRIKCEPIVQKTQLYGNPRPSDIERSFLLMYILNDMPAVRKALVVSDPPGKRQFTFALSLSPHGVATVRPHAPPPAMRPGHALKDETHGGYIGNIALQLEADGPSMGESNIWAPRNGAVWTWPSTEQAEKARLRGKMFYELHPQLWRMGLMREAVEEVVRFGFEELGVVEISVDPTEGNVGSIKLATDLGFVFQKRVHTESNAQLWHVLSRATYLERNGQLSQDCAWAGKILCRWCMVDHGAEPTVRCEACDWGRWCSPECRRADWLFDKGHRAAGGCSRKGKAGKS